MAGFDPRNLTDFYNTMTGPGGAFEGFNPYNFSMSMPAVDMDLINQINGQGDVSNPGGGTDYAVMPSDQYTYTNSPQAGNGLYPGMPQSPAYTAPGGGTNTPPPPQTPNPTYPTGGANSTPMGSENGMYTGANQALDTTRFTPTGGAAAEWYNQLFGQNNPNQISYLGFADQLGRQALAAAGGNWTNGDSIATQQAYMNSAAGQQWLQGLRGVRPQPQPPAQQPVQQTRPMPPLQAAPLPPPQQQQPAFNPAAAMRYQPAMPQQQNPYTNPYGSQYQPPRLQIEQQNPFTMGQVMQPYSVSSFMGTGGPDPYSGMMTDMQYRGGGGQPQQQNIQQLIAAAMARGAMGNQLQPGSSAPGYGQQQWYPGVEGQRQYINPTVNYDPNYDPSQGIQRTGPRMWGGQVVDEAATEAYMRQRYAQQPQQGGYMGSPAGQQSPYAQLLGRGQQQQMPSFSSDPGMNLARMYEMAYGSEGGGGQPLPSIDFRAATFGGPSQPQQTQQSQQQPSGSFASQFSSPSTSSSSSSSSYNAATPWANITSNRQPAMGQNYGWGGRGY